MATQYAQSAISAPEVSQANVDKRYLIGPVADFLCFGGASFFILPLLLLLPLSEYEIALAAVMMIAANFINHPHFAHSYQIFYRGYRRKAFTPLLGRVMQARYLFAGLIAPAVLIGFFVICFANKDIQLLGYAGNAMALFVGWHYVKQGYGMLMVDSILKRRFFSTAEKKLLLFNCYVVWIASWMSLNDAISKKDFWGISYYSFDIPNPVVMIVLAAALSTSGATIWMLLGRWRRTGALPANGVIAYFASLYPWLAFIGFNPLWILVVPALHSLQYLAVVWRFQTNYERVQLVVSKTDSETGLPKKGTVNPFPRLALFILIGGFIGFCGFWYIPSVLTTFVPYGETIFGGGVFLFAAWIFINIHHYFIDNVMWRRENPDMGRYLLS